MTWESQIRTIFEGLLKRKDGETLVRLNDLRKAVLEHGIPTQSEEELKKVDIECSLRGRIWKILLGVTRVEADRYIECVRRGPSPLADKIERDRDRTFQHDDAFEKAVPQSKLVRLTNAFVHHANDTKVPYGYVQSLNLVAGMFLYIMPEPDAFACYSSLVRDHLPLYYNMFVCLNHSEIPLQSQFKSLSPIFPHRVRWGENVSNSIRFRMCERTTKQNT